MLHGLDSRSSPEQGKPPCFGGGLSHFLVLKYLEPPHDFGQSVKSVQELHPPLTVRIEERSQQCAHNIIRQYAVTWTFRN